MGERCAKNRPFTCWINRQWRSLLMGAIALCCTVAFERTVGVPAVASSSRYRGKPIRNSSSPAKIALAQYLTQVGAKMYGAYWCHHCHKQKQMLGKQAIVQIDYIECSPNGHWARPAEVCQAAEIVAYPGANYTRARNLWKN